MSSHCSRCGRRHSGICGIPPGVGPAPGPAINPQRPATLRPVLDNTPGHPAAPARPHGKALADLLRWSLREQRRLEAVLKSAPESAADYDSNLREYDRVGEVIRQLRVQLAERRDSRRAA